MHGTYIALGHVYRKEETKKFSVLNEHSMTLCVVLYSIMAYGVGKWHASSPMESLDITQYDSLIVQYVAEVGPRYVATNSWGI